MFGVISNRNQKIILIIAGVICGLIAFIIIPWHDRTLAFILSSQESISITNPVGDADDKISDSTEFSTYILGDPWDMNQLSDLYLPSSPHCNLPRSFKNITNSNGIWSATSNALPGDSPNFWLLFPGYKGSLQIGKLGSVKPIDTNKFYKLSFRLYLSAIKQPPFDPLPWDTIQIYWTDGDLGDVAKGRCEISSTITPVQGWHVYEVDLRTIGTQANSFCTDHLGGWTGNKNGPGLVTGLRLDPIANNGVTVMLDWARLTGDDEARNQFNIQWNTNNLNNALVNLYLDNNTDPNDGLLNTIRTNIPASEGSYQWIARSMPPGKYYVYARMSSDYAGISLSDPWDMKQTTDVDEIWGISPIFNDGYLNGTTTSNGGFINLQLNSLQLIDPSLYEKVVFRQNTYNASKHYTVWWQDSDPYANPPDPWVRYGIDIPLSIGWKTYELDLGTISGWNNGKLKKAFRLLPVIQSNETFQLDWVALTTGITPSSETDLFPQTSYSPGQLTVNTPPILTINAPSMTSGADYPTENMANPWDMNDASDIASTSDIINPTFNGGIYQASGQAVNQDCSDGGSWGDSIINLKMGDLVDSDRFRYFSVRMKVDGTQDVGWGWVGRIIFYQLGYYNPEFPNIPGDHAVINDIILTEGWNTYTVDLGDNSRPYPNGLYDDEEQSWSTWTSISPSMIRFDPHEIPNSLPLTFQIDDIKLTAKDTADSSYFVQWAITNPDNNTLTTKLYYSTVAGGGTDILIGTVPVGATSYKWNTLGVSEGEYYIKVEVNDNYNTTAWYSQSPLVVAHTGKAVLSVAPGTLILMAEIRGGQTTIGKFIVDNLGSNPMSWTITAPNWLKVNPSSGVDGPAEVIVTPNIGGLAKGTYSGEIKIDGGIAGIQIVQVTLVIVDDLFNSYVPLMIR